MDKPVVVIGGSAGSIELLSTIISEIPAKLPIAWVIVIHRNSSSPRSMHRYMDKICPMPVLEIEHAMDLEPKKVYIAPPDYHCLIGADDKFYLERSERENYCRPSIDATFESFSYQYQNKLIGVVLTGANSDGSIGAGHIVRRGGSVIVQDPDTAFAKAMPKIALSRLGDNAEIVEPEKLIDAISKTVGKQKLFNTG